MELRDALLLGHRNGYCLWVGAGVTLYLTSVGPFPTPTWLQLVQQLESAASIKSPSFDCSLPERLEVVRTKLGRINFQRELRNFIILPLANSVIYNSKQYSQPFAMPPLAQQIACLGMLANPIVNFNIEPITSILLTKPGGPYSIKAFQPPIEGASSIISKTGSSNCINFVRSAFHPHGCIDLSGLCVLTENDYQAMNGTLALQLACHASFQEILFIVGMSMEDTYLREQIAIFRKQIGQIIWFLKNEPSIEIRKWAWKNNISLVQVSQWSDFWNTVEEIFPKPSHEAMLTTWHSIVNSAFRLKEPVNPLFSMMVDQGYVNSEWQLANENRGLADPRNHSIHDFNTNVECELLCKAYLIELNKIYVKKTEANT